MSGAANVPRRRCSVLVRLLAKLAGPVIRQIMNEEWAKLRSKLPPRTPIQYPLRLYSPEEIPQHLLPPEFRHKATEEPGMREPTADSTQADPAVSLILQIERTDHWDNGSVAYRAILPDGSEGTFLSPRGASVSAETDAGIIEFILKRWRSINERRSQSAPATPELPHRGIRQESALTGSRP